LGRACSKDKTHGNAYKFLIGKSVCKRTLQKPRRKWEEDIKTNVREIELDGKDWINVAQDRKS
jgi:hypothetical protein